MVPFILESVANNTSPAAALSPVSVSSTTLPVSVTDVVSLKSMSAVAPPSVWIVMPPILALAAFTSKPVNAALVAPTLPENVTVSAAVTVKPKPPSTVLSNDTSPCVLVTVRLAPDNVTALLKSMLPPAVSSAPKLMPSDPEVSERSVRAMMV